MKTKYLADKLTTLLTGNNTFIITDDQQYFSNEIHDEGIKYIPGVLTLQSDYKNLNKYYKENRYRITFHVFKNKKDSFIDDIKMFIENETPETYNNDILAKLYQEPIFNSEIDFDSEGYLVYDWDFVYMFYSTITGDSTELKIDNVVVPFTRIERVHDIGYISSVMSGANYRLTEDSILLVIPLILSNPKVLELKELVDSDDYNVKLDISINGSIKTMAVKQMTYVIEKTSGATNLNILCDNWYPRIPVSINGVGVVISSFRAEMKKQSTLAPVDNGSIAKAYGENKIRTWSMTIVKENNQLITDLMTEFEEDSIDQTYTLTKDGKSYTVYITNLIETYTESGDMAIEVAFNEYGN